MKVAEKGSGQNATGQNATGQNATANKCMRCSAEQDCKYSGTYLGVGPLRLGPLWR